MAEENKMSEVVDEVKNDSEDELRETIEKWFESTRMDGVRHGAYMISAAVFDAINKNLKKGTNSSLRDYQRAVKRVVEIVSVQLKQQETQQNDSEEATDIIKEDHTNG
jgi:hypothetical protein